MDYLIIAISFLMFIPLFYAVGMPLPSCIACYVAATLYAFSSLRYLNGR